MPVLVSIILLLSAATVFCPAATASGYEDCAKKLSTLERALYETEDNLFYLNRVFYPPSTRTSRFIRVTFSFLNESGDDNNCFVSYVWAIGGFLFFQPPNLFQWSTLFFNYPNNDLNNLVLKLPHECRPLIDADATDTECSCLKDSHSLDVLTQQVKILLCNG